MSSHDGPGIGATAGEALDDERWDDPRIVAAIHEYMALVETGQKLDRQEFLARFPEIAEELGECLAGLELVQAAAGVAATPANLPLNFGGLGNEPQPLGDFRIVREIGRGGMGVVYEAMQLSLGRRVAIKVLPFAAALDPKQLQRFKNEAQAAAQLHHTNIVPVYAVGCERGVHFYAMQLIEGQPLSVLIRQLRQLSGRTSENEAVSGETSGQSQSISGLANSMAFGRFVPPAPRDEPTAPFIPPAQSSASQKFSGQTAPNFEGSKAAPSTEVAASLTTQQSSSRQYFRTVARLAQQTAEALEHAHQLGVVHRDVKPANLLIDERGNLWVTDFGLAQFHAEVGLTRTGDMLGTMRYMSPEQTVGNRAVLDHRTDIYSLGVTLYEMLTLEPLFGGLHRADLLRRILEDDPHPPRSIDKNIPIELETIVLKSLAKSPQERYPTAQALADDLQRFLDDKPILARRPTLFEQATKWSRRHRALVVSALVLLALTTAGLLASTIIIARAHAETKEALDREATERARAEESFRQAQQAVDTFTALCEDELVDRPSLQRLRRKFLETSFDYYQNFVEQRGEDPSLGGELAASKARVSRLLDELTTLEGYRPLLLFNVPDVQKDLATSEDQREEIAELSEELSKQQRQAMRSRRPLDPQGRRQALMEMFREREARITKILTPEQMRRLQEIALQQQELRAFEDRQIIEALKLNVGQREQIRSIVEETMQTLAETRPDDPAEARQNYKKVMAAGFASALQILTPEQRDQWNQLTGKPFEGDLHRWHGGFGPGHGPRDRLGPPREERR